MPTTIKLLPKFKSLFTSNQSYKTHYISKYEGMAGLQEINAESGKVNCWPNPAVNSITIKVDASLLSKSFTIFDRTGRRVSQGFLQQTESRLTLDGISNGIYLLQVQGEPGVKIIKQ